MNLNQNKNNKSRQNYVTEERKKMKNRRDEMI